MVRRLVGPRFRRAGTSVERMRDLMDSLAARQRISRGTVVEPVEVDGLGAEWVRAPGADPDAAALYLHGGAFVMGSPASHRELAAYLSAAIRAPLLSLDYRLAPEHPFPAAIEDAQRAWRWVLGRGIPRERLAIGGDSSGGGLALQTLLMLRDRGEPLPAAAFLLSPQTDFVRFDGASFRERGALDPLQTPETCRFTAGLYVGDADPTEPLLAPVEADLTGLPPLCIHAGDHDLLLSDALRLAERAETCGVRVECEVWPGMWHVFHAAARFVPEARRSLECVGTFVSAALAPPPTALS